MKVLLLSAIFLFLIGFFVVGKPLQRSPAVVSYNASQVSCNLSFQGNQYSCAIGKTGVTADKKEGDAATPIGTFKIRKIFYRPDRINPAELKTNIPIVALTPNDGWCDDVNSPKYNKQVALPFSASHENLWRDDHVYDIIAVLSYNDNPVIKDKGSAIFLHIAKPGYAPTVGCIALKKQDLLAFIAQFTKNDVLKVTSTAKN